MPQSIGLDISPLYTTHRSHLNRSHQVSPLIVNFLPQQVVENPITNCSPTQLTHRETQVGVYCEQGGVVVEVIATTSSATSRTEQMFPFI